MKKRAALWLALSLAVVGSLPAEESATKPTPKSDQETATAAIPASAAQITAPLVLKDGAISQPDKTELPEGGKAIFKLSVPKDGTYVIHAIVNAADEDSNSFYLNIDAQPEDPLMIWDMDVTKGFEERVVSWRGNGDSNSDEFVPKKFTLKAGEHKAIVIGREPTQLKSISIRPVAN